MPLTNDLGWPVIRCVNFHGHEYGPRQTGERDPEHPERSKEPPQTTMGAMPGWYLAPKSLDPKDRDLYLPRLLPAGRIAAPGVAIGVSPPMGMPLQIFICSKCGYVEMYAGWVVSPTEWPSRPGETAGG